ncbi:MAG: bifunctional UDP-N-acetylglucosamine diphosphorylase/glucosamine-1-phosphate N-acetyltransferase GlmU [Alphaproteobacteria bacterium]|nr:bifunctional UDP-N-acetylglucosamine diphosphorylase/glucosamine-1-phosphate N-acetyltransferase GlmU [Alphaproteobacteria bacterium]
MAKRKTAAVILAAGMGTRMKSALPKVLHPIAGQPMIRYLLNTVESVGFDRVVVVVGPEMEAVAAAVQPHAFVVQSDRLGTGHAVAQAGPALADFDGDVAVLYGDSPLITSHTLQRMGNALQREPGPAVVVLGFQPRDPAEYGRLMVPLAEKSVAEESGGQLDAIVEFREATPEQRSVTLCNSGVMMADRARLFAWLSRVDNANAKGEYYLTDVVGLARGDGLSCAYVVAPETECFGVNSRQELAQAEAMVQERLRNAAMDSGVTLIDPGTVTFCQDTRLGRDVVVYPHVVFGPGVTVADGVVIKSFCHFEDAAIRRGATIGPYARLRPGAEIGEGAHIGNFVEIKKATVEAGAKVSHLSYIGDGRIGAGANIGAGTIFCNYDGFTKGFTDIGPGAFIGSNSALVAPVSVGAGAIVGAGSVITKNVSADALAVARGKQMEVTGWAATFRASKGEKK